MVVELLVVPLGLLVVLPGLLVVLLGLLVVLVGLPGPVAVEAERLLAQAVLLLVVPLAVAIGDVVEPQVGLIMDFLQLNYTSARNLTKISMHT